MLAIYCRVSTDEQADKGISLDNQETRGKELAKKLHLKYKVYIDAGISGNKPIEKRPGLLSMVNDIKNKLITTVYVLNQSRLDRGDNIQFAHIKNIFKTHKLKLYYNTELIDYNNINVELSMDLQGVINNFYLKQTAESISSNLQKAVKSGGVAGGPLITYGYKKGDNKKMVVDPNEAEVVKLIYELASQGKGTRVIANILNKKGIPTKRGNVTTGKKMKVRGETKTEFVWRDAVVLRVLKNTIYKGIRIYKGQEYTNIEPIIDPVVFDLIQEQLKTRNQFKNTTNLYEYLLKGLITCPICGSNIQGKKRANGKDNCYTCTSNRNGPNCGNRGINIEYLEDLVEDCVLTLDDIVLKAFDHTETKERTERHKSSLASVKAEIANIEKEEDALIELATKTSSTRVAKKLDELQTLKNYKISFKEACEKELLIEKEKETLLEVAKAGVKEYGKLKSFNDRANFLRSVISEIRVIWNDGVYTIRIYFKINQLQSYLITKEMLIDRNSRKAGKILSKVLSENVTIQTFISADETNNNVDTIPYINYTDYVENHTLRNFKRVLLKTSSK